MLTDLPESEAFGHEWCTNSEYLSWSSTSMPIQGSWIRKINNGFEFFNGIIDITDSRVKESIQSKLNKKQQTWLNKVLEKQTWNITPEFKDYCSQFTEDTCNRVHTSTLIQKSFIVGCFDPFLHERHNIAQCICI